MHTQATFTALSQHVSIYGHGLGHVRNHYTSQYNYGVRLSFSDALLVFYTLDLLIAHQTVKL